MVRNLNGHEIVVIDQFSDEIVVRLPSEGFARASVKREHQGFVKVTDKGGYAPVSVTSFGAPVDLPDPEPDVFLVVSRVTAEAARAHGRNASDLLIPDNLIRNEKGQPIGCYGFAMLETQTDEH